MGPVLTTRNAITVSETRQGGDFWKWTDVIDNLATYKLRALGISEAFLTGDASYATAETSLGVFMDNIRAYRDMFTQRLLTNKVFPLLATYHDFKSPEENGKGSSSSQNYEANHTGKWDIPSVRWHKSLEPNGERDTFELLNTLEEKGYPIPMRMWAAAAGVDPSSLENEVDDDIKLRKKLKAYKDAVDGVMPTEGPAEDEVVDNVFGGGSDEFARSLTGQSFGNRMRPHWGSTGGQHDMEITATTRTGKKKWVYNQRAANTRLHENIAKASGALKDPNNLRRVTNNVTDRLGHMPNVAY